MTLRLLFVLLWSSAAIVAKFGLNSAPPLSLATTRFILAGVILFIYVYVVRRSRKYSFPKREEWFQLLILGLLNTTLYLGLTFWALKSVSAGFFNLFVTVNPFIVALLSSFFLQRKIQCREWIGMGVSAFGLFVAIYPTLKYSSASIAGLILLTIGMIAMASGSVYYKKIGLKLPGIVINTWQVLLGGGLLLPFTFLLEDQKTIKIDAYFIGSLTWLVFAISIGAMILWFYLLKQDPVKANNWLFLTPVFGYILAFLCLGESITIFDVIATPIVLTGLIISGNIHFNRKLEIK